MIRGGWGRFIESPLGFSLVSGWAVSASFVPLYQNTYNPADGSGQNLSFPSPFPANLNQPGTASFEYAFPIHYKDPSVQQWNLTFEHDWGHDVGMRLSYTGSHGINLENFNDLNQVPANTGVAAPLVYPIWGIIQSVVNQAVSNYNSWTAVRKSGCRMGCSSRRATCLLGIFPTPGARCRRSFRERAATG